MALCSVDTARGVLQKAWRAAEDGPRETRAVLAHAARLATEVSVGLALPAHLDELGRLIPGLLELDAEAGRALRSALVDGRSDWDQHVFERNCAAGVCFVRVPPPCQAACPAGIDIPGFLALIGHGRHQEALDVLLADTPLPCSCGLVCPAPCQTACLRGAAGSPVFIRPMKATAAEHALAAGGAYPRRQPATPTGKRVAIVGSGPTGITAAYFLALRGHRVEIFEASDLPGGMMRYGIPAYRLPAEVLDREIENLLSLGVVIHTASPVTDVAQLPRQGFDAGLLAMGLQRSSRIPLDGIDLDFVLGGVDFLRDVRRGQDPRVGPHAVVVGGGNVAVDVALTALRQGAAQVTMVCLEARHEMPASPDEIRTATEEGVEIRNGWGPIRVAPDHAVTFQRCTRVFDEQRRFSPRFAPDERMHLHADHVLLAVGQAADLSALEGTGVKINRGLILADPASLATGEPGLFAAGDVLHGPRTVVDAVRAGKQAAEAIDAFLTGRPLGSWGAAPRPRADVPPLATGVRERSVRQRSEMPERDAGERRGSYRQIELGLTDEMAHAEAARCLRCDLCVGCGLCELVCSEMGPEALRMVETPASRLAFDDFARPARHCVGCGACAQVCPTGAIRVEDREGVRATIITGTVVQELPVLTCAACGRPHVPHPVLGTGAGPLGPRDGQPPSVSRLRQNRGGPRLRRS